MINQSAIITILAIIIFSMAFVALPANIQAQQQTLGCCQFEGDEAGCWYPADPDACANMDGKYFEDAKCNTDITQCVENKKDDSSSSESGK